MGTYPANWFSPGAYVNPFNSEVYYLVGSGQTIAAWDAVLAYVLEALAVEP